MADVITDTFGMMKDKVVGGGGAVAGGSSIGPGLIWGIGLFVGIAILAVIGALVWYFWYEKRQWNIITRVHYENPVINGVTIGNGVPTKRVRFKDGRVVYMYKSPIQGYTISPELLTWTRPREHDVIVTQDKKLFCIIGITNIDERRKQLKVDISYPDIEMDRQDLQHFIDSKKFDDPNERFKIIAKVALWIFAFVAIIVVAVIASKTYTDNRAIDLERERINLQVSENQAEVMASVNTFMAILQKAMPETFKQIEQNKLIISGTTS